MSKFNLLLKMENKLFIIMICSLQFIKNIINNIVLFKVHQTLKI